MDDDEFVLIYPCYVIEREDRKGVMTINVDGSDCVALLTDEDNAWTLRGDTPGRLVTLNDPQELSEYLRSIHSNRFSHVSLDPIGRVGKGVYRISISDFLENLVQQDGENAF